VHIFCINYPILINCAIVLEFKCTFPRLAHHPTSIHLRFSSSQKIQKMYAIHTLLDYKLLLSAQCPLVIAPYLASIVLPDDVARYAYRQGLFVLAQSGDAVIIRNDDKFRPKHW